MALAAVFILASLSSFPLIAQEPPRQADALVVLGGDHKPDRIRLAAKLYRAGYASLVILSAGTEVRQGDEILPESEVLLVQALQAGIPRDVMLLEEQSQTTLENARYTEGLLQEHRVRSILLITSAYQSARADRMFKDCYRETVRVIIQPAFPDGFCAPCWPLHMDQIPVVLSEYRGWLAYLILGR